MRPWLGHRPPLYLSLLLCLMPLKPVPAAAGQVRRYYLAADLVEWDYAPSGHDELMKPMQGDKPMAMHDPPPPADECGFAQKAPTPMHMHDEHLWLDATRTRIGTRYTKALYRAYTNDSFSQLAPIPPEWAHLGALGPVLRAQVGDTLTVVFRNNLAFPASIHPHGVRYDKRNEGAPYNDGQIDLGDVVDPGATYTYNWQLRSRQKLARAPWTLAALRGREYFMLAWDNDAMRARASDAPSHDSRNARYHSHVNEPMDTAAGLIGAIIVTAVGRARADASPTDVDQELLLSFFNYDESMSPMHMINIQVGTTSAHYMHHLNTSGNLSTDCLARILSDNDYALSNKMYGINGLVYGNLHLPTLRVGQRTRWYLIAFGNMDDIHTPHWHGNTVLHEGHRKDVLQLLPAATTVADMSPYNIGLSSPAKTPESIGEWMFQCHVHHHIHGGMYTKYAVAAAASPTHTPVGHGNSRPRPSVQHFVALMCTRNSTMLSGFALGERHRSRMSVATATYSRVNQA
ncbi:uncharacterized protein MONBRDRAFT_29422 [Monosiga brevicollis MX1]|uniref:Plastocyanin-like domain-containing protein n=1 Tax=Monosiga brevicollis TaxID=81824 RepID=A9VB17_MONBE|nr:uncharacterized protein MONBRDRAFT_29422 [Monosiga brevicollis MX1]EDQ85314.1 predicted protein [Monosiga brevicollis MX1]|eukprot:XP_001749935.1 hypothetical protein [Monosiga brevicollis MX1]